MHKRSRTESGQLGIVWWNMEYRDNRLGLRRIKVKKEEPSTPSLQIKVKSPPTPSLAYPPSQTTHMTKSTTRLMLIPLDTSLSNDIMKSPENNFKMPLYKNG